MKIGAENKKELIAMIVLMVIAIPSSIYLIKSLSGSPSATPAQAASASAPQKKSGGAFPIRNLDPTMRTDRLAASQKVQYEGGRRNIFRMEEPRPPVTKDTVGSVAQQQSTAPPAYVPPPITVKFYGFSTTPGEPKKVFLADGDDIFVAREGEIINRKYKVVQIMNSAVVIEDLLNNNRQQIPIMNA